MSQLTFTDSPADFPAPGAPVFLVGIGGIGMSALAQYLAACGYQVAGSDRALENPDNASLYSKLRLQGIRLFPQDGSGPAAFHAAAAIVSAAVEPGNPDLAHWQGPLFHRAAVLSELCRRQRAPFIGIAGSCGKTSTTAWIAAALRAAGFRIAMINGGYVLDFITADRPGNFCCDASPQFVVAEIDESDKSINCFSPDFGLVLNIGDDHYSRDELAAVFNRFLQRCRKTSAAPLSLRTTLPAASVYYDDTPQEYSCSRAGIVFRPAPDAPLIHSTQWGRCSAANGTAVFTLLKSVLSAYGTGDDAIAQAMGAYCGVQQRFEIVSPPGAAVTVINDYAHNPEKIAAAIVAARERYNEPLTAIFQPHGFGPLGFMRDTLAARLKEVLRPGDELLLLPVYYAGGTASFSPTSAEVAAQYAHSGLNVRAVADRMEAAAYLRTQPCRLWLVLGARDPSLRTWAIRLASA